MHTSTSTELVAVARRARALTYGLAALAMEAVIDWLTDRIAADMGYAG